MATELPQSCDQSFVLQEQAPQASHWLARSSWWPSPHNWKTCQVFLRDSYCDQQLFWGFFFWKFWNIWWYLMSLDSLLAFGQLYYTHLQDLTAQLSTPGALALRKAQPSENWHRERMKRWELGPSCFACFVCLASLIQGSFWSTDSKVTTLLQGPRRDAPGCGEERNRWAGGICHCESKHLEGMASTIKAVWYVCTAIVLRRASAGPRALLGSLKLSTKQQLL